MSTEPTGGATLSPAQPPASPPPEDDSEALFGISIASAAIGALALAVAGIMYWTVSSSAAGATFPSFFDKRQWVLAIGTGLFVLGVGLQANRIWELVYRRRSVFALNVILMSGLAIALTVLVDYVTTRHFHEFDWTRQGVFTISDESVQVAKSLNRDIRVWVIFREGGDADLVKRLVDHYRAKNPRIEIVVFDPLLDSEKLLDAIRQLGLEPTTIDDVEGVVVQAGYYEPVEGGGQTWHTDKSKRLTRSDFFDAGFDPMSGQRGQKKFRGEQALTNALLEVTEEKKHKLYFTQGHKELDMEGRNPGDYGQAGNFVKTLRNKNYDVAALNLVEKRDVPDDASALVIVGPRDAFDPAEVAAIDKFLKEGGKVLALVGAEIKRVSENDFEWRSLGLEPLFKKYGVTVDNSLILSLERGQLRDGRIVERPAQGALATQFDATSKITQPLMGTRAAMMNPRVIKATSDNPHAKATEILKTFSGCATVSDLTDLSKKATEAIRGERKSVPVMVASEQKLETKPGEKEKVTRLVVVGDATLASNYALDQFSHEALLLNSFSWLLGQERFSKEPVKEGDYHLDITPEVGFMFQLLACPGVPFLAIVLGVTVWIVRRR